MVGVVNWIIVLVRREMRCDGARSSSCSGLGRMLEAFPRLAPRSLPSWLSLREWERGAEMM